MPTTDERLAELERRLDELDRQFDDLLRVLQNTRELTPEQRRAIRRKTAARARASKPVGGGKGAVKSEKTKRKLNREAK